MRIPPPTHLGCPNPQHILSLSAVDVVLTGADIELRRESSVQGSITEPFTPVQSPAAWYAADYRDSNEWIYRLTSEDLAELEAAVAEVEASGADVQVQAQDAGHPRDNVAVVRFNIVRVSETLTLFQAPEAATGCSDGYTGKACMHSGRRT